MAATPGRRTPWIAVDVDGRKDPKVVDLPGDTARYGYFLGVLAEARLATPRGVFGSRAALEEAIGRFASHVDDYLAAGLLERSPQLCTECRQRYGAPKAGAIVVHNWHRKQHDPTHAQRQRRYEAARRNGDGESDGPADAEPDAQPDGDMTAASVSPASEPDGDTRARAVTRDTRHVTPDTDTREDPPARARARAAKPAQPGGRRAGTSHLSIEADDARYPVARLLATRFRWKTITGEQWAMLTEVVDNEFPVGTKRGRDPSAGWQWLAGELARLKRNAGSPLDAFLASYNAELERRRSEADADEAAWQETKARYADDAGPIASELAAKVGTKANGHTARQVPRAQAIEMLRGVRGTVNDTAWARLLERYGVSEEELATHQGDNP